MDRNAPVAALGAIADFARNDSLATMIGCCEDCGRMRVSVVVHHGDEMAQLADVHCDDPFTGLVEAHGEVADAVREANIMAEVDKLDDELGDVNGESTGGP